MCRSLNDPCGGRRCQPRNKSSRKVNQIASETLSSQLTAKPATFKQEPETSSTTSLEELRNLPTAEAIQEWKNMRDSNAINDKTLEEGLTIIGEKVDQRAEEISEEREEALYMELDEMLEKVYSKDETIELLKHELLTASPQEAENINQQLVALENMGTEEEEIEKSETAFQEKLLQIKKESYIEALQEVRELGASMTNVHFDETTNVYEEPLKETVFAHYPTEWLKHHEDAEGFHIVEDSESFYAPSIPHEDGEELKVVKTIRSLNLNDEYEGDENAARLRAAFHQKIVSNYNSVNGSLDSMRYFYTFEDDDEAFDPEIHGDEPSPEDGWEYRESFLSFVQTPPTNEEEFESAVNNKQWVRRKTDLTPHRKEMHLMSDAAKEQTGMTGHKFDAVLYHEFGHRFEEVLPDDILPRMEKAFILRRSGKTEETMHEGMLKDIFEQSYYHEGRFVDKYVGRDYLVGNNYEVFTTGVEAVYGKGYGGLVGQGSHNADSDHRRFTLGALATL